MADSTLCGLDAPGVWDSELAYRRLNKLGKAATRRTAERRLNALGFLPAELTAQTLLDEFGRKANALILHWELEQVRSKRHLALFVQLHGLPDGRECLHANDARGARYWIPLKTSGVNAKTLLAALLSLKRHIGKETAVFPHGRLVGMCRRMENAAHANLRSLSWPPVLDPDAKPGRFYAKGKSPLLKRLEAESIHIIREAVAESIHPVMLYSIGKDSSVMLHLARKAFYPAKPPLPLLHVDTRWKFQEMYLFRDMMARESGMELLVHVNPEAVAKNINPFDHGSAVHTDITKTEGLKQALDHHKFDVVFGGARRDEEKSRAKERIFSLRSATHRWDPKNQRPELWNLYNARKRQGESVRVFPLSNWTELDIWHYILEEGIPVVPLYFAKERAVVVRNGLIILVDDERMRLLPGERIEARRIRFRTLGCYPLTGAIESAATSVREIILELVNARNSERQGRAIDSDAAASMEKKKQEGYF